MTTECLFLDLDNTLYDWLDYFAPAFRGLCLRISEMSGVKVNSLYEDFREVFAEHGTVEYSFAVQEVASLRILHPGWRGSDIVNYYRPALDVFQHRRRNLLRLYGGVREGIQSLRGLGIRCVAVTDAHRFQAANRLRQLKLDNLLSGLACRPDHRNVSEAEIARIRRFPADRYSSRISEFVFPSHLRKPDPRILLWLMEQLSLRPNQCAYVGDSLRNDIKMAQSAGVRDCWAAYGARYAPMNMATLTRITHWDSVSVQAALQPAHLGITPTCVARSFQDVVRFAALRVNSPSSTSVSRVSTLLEQGL